MYDYKHKGMKNQFYLNLLLLYEYALDFISCFEK